MFGLLVSLIVSSVWGVGTSHTPSSWEAFRVFKPVHLVVGPPSTRSGKLYIVSLINHLCHCLATHSPIPIF
jgi:hypothetical protein